MSATKVDTHIDPEEGQSIPDWCSFQKCDFESFDADDFRKCEICDALLCEEHGVTVGPENCTYVLCRSCYREEMRHDTA